MALTTGIALLSSQYAYNSNGPFDAKMLVGTTEELYSPATWQNKEGENLAYNGMIVAVWRERNENAYKNGLYLLHDGKVNNKFLIDATDITKSTISKPENWHKIANLDEVYTKTEIAALIGTPGTPAEGETAAELGSGIYEYVYSKAETDKLIAGITGGDGSSTEVLNQLNSYIDSNNSKIDKLESAIEAKVTSDEVYTILEEAGKQFMTSDSIAAVINNTNSQIADLSGLVTYATTNAANIDALTDFVSKHDASIDKYDSAIEQFNALNTKLTKETSELSLSENGFEIKEVKLNKLTQAKDDDLIVLSGGTAVTTIDKVS